MRLRQPQGQIQVGAVAAKLVAAYGLKGKTVSPNLGTELVPVVLVDDLVNRSNWYGQSVDRPAGGGILAFAPVAGNFGEVALTNPSNSGLLVLCESIIYSSTGGGTVRIRFQPGQILTAQTTGTFRDTRIKGPGGSPISTAEIRTNSAAAEGIGNIVGGTVSSVSVVQQYPINFVIGPGQALKVCGTAIDQVLSAMFLWRERTIEVAADEN